VYVCERGGGRGKGSTEVVLLERTACEGVYGSTDLNWYLVGPHQIASQVIFV